MHRGTAALILVITLATTACGAGSHPAATSKPDYLTRVNQICARYNGLVRAVGQPTGTLEQQAATSRRVNALTRTEISAVRDVPPPSGDQSRLATILDETARAADLGDESSRLIVTDEIGANQKAAQAAALLKDANGKFAAYGLTTCAQ